MQARQWMMWHRVWSMIGVGGVLLVAPASAQQGGLPACQAALTSCNADLGACQTDLSTCEGEPNVVFPGDGVNGPPLSYRDNGDRTTTDLNTGLMWEQKDTTGGIHDIRVNRTKVRGVS
jgi:hypothetical protein